MIIPRKGASRGQITTAMRKLLSICGEYATEYCTSFNASKSKYLAAMHKLNKHYS